MATDIPYNETLTCALSVKDLGVALDWYTTNLGFTEMYRVDEVGWAEMETSVPGVTIGVSATEEGGGAGGATLTFGVTDCDAARAKLEANGVTFDGETRIIPGLVKLATFFDADGNALMFAESLSAS